MQRKRKDILNRHSFGNVGFAIRSKTLVQKNIFLRFSGITISETNP